MRHSAASYTASGIQEQLLYDKGRDLQAQRTPPSELADKVYKDHYTFAVVPKQLITFFEPTGIGCQDQVARLTNAIDKVTVDCLYVGPSEANNRGAVQAQMVEELLWRNAKNETADQTDAPTIDGLAISVVDADLMTPILNRAKEELNIPIVTFDSDAPDSARSYYIGTDNAFFGRQMARQMESLNPAGGTYGIIAGESTNLQARANGIIQELFDQTANSHTTWEPLEGSPFDAQNNLTLALEKMEGWATQNPTVLVSVTGLPMRIIEADDDSGQSYAPWQGFVDDNKHRNITLLCADATDHQITFLKYNYIDGLAGQLPYDMGVKSIASLWTLIHDPEAKLGDSEDDDFIGTNVRNTIRFIANGPPFCFKVLILTSFETFFRSYGLSTSHFSCRPSRST